MRREPARVAPSYLQRRDFVKTTAAASALALALSSEDSSVKAVEPSNISRFSFSEPDSLYHGNGWESLNPGYWQIRGKALRRRLSNFGDRARSTGFPFHYYNQGKVMPTEYDPSLPEGILYRREFKMEKSFSLLANFTYLADRPPVRDGDNDQWKMYQDGRGWLGIAFGAKSLFESFNRIRHANQIVWSDDGKLQCVVPAKQRKTMKVKPRVVPRLKRGDKVSIAMSCDINDGNANIKASLSINGDQVGEISLSMPAYRAQGFVGLTGRGMVDFEVNSFVVDSGKNVGTAPKPIECYSCYALGDSLREDDGQWKVRFVSLFESDGTQAEVRVSTEENPSGGWENVPAAGKSNIVNHRWRRNTATIEATLPTNPALSTLYYTVWKDGQNVTADPRVGSGSCGPGTGLVGDVPASGSYVGRLPQLTAPYKFCGLSCHAITSGLQEPSEDGYSILGGGDRWQVRDQPTLGAYKHLEDYDFQVMLWEDDVWYMELVLYPPSTDDAYKVIKNSICGPTSRWQMMRHWNVINPGDHDYGMDDVKGPEQIAIRRVEGLGQDRSYMQRNFQIVHHLITGDEEVDPLSNPKKWRAWKMPNRDFTFVILDSRLWRSSQDTDMWDDEGWADFKNLYDRTDPTRSLLGEEQFSWLEQLLATDSSPLICLTGINGMHTVWTGQNWKSANQKKLPIEGPFDQRDRVTADYAGWVKAGSDRVLELLGRRSGVTTVYGDVHNGCIMTNKEHRVVECSFGPIGRSGGRAVIPGFGRQMKDFDGRQIEVHALYHKSYSDPDLNGHKNDAPFYWNFLELEFHPWLGDGNIQARVRNMVDAPEEKPRGGGELALATEQTGREVQSLLPEIRTLPNADVLFMTVNGRPLRATRSDENGVPRLNGLPGIQTGRQILMTANDGVNAESKIFRTISSAS
ncbi:MAG: hypothetical protein AAF483_21700 [Planctomycetota bacterium]